MLERRRPRSPRNSPEDGPGTLRPDRRPQQPGPPDPGELGRYGRQRIRESPGLGPDPARKPPEKTGPDVPGIGVAPEVPRHVRRDPTGSLQKPPWRDGRRLFMY